MTKPNQTTLTSSENPQSHHFHINSIPHHTHHITKHHNGTIKSSPPQRHHHLRRPQNLFPHIDLTSNATIAPSLHRSPDRKHTHNTIHPLHKTFQFLRSSLCSSGARVSRSGSTRLPRRKRTAHFPKTECGIGADETGGMFSLFTTP